MKKLVIAVAAALSLPALAQTYYAPSNPSYAVTAEERPDWRRDANRDAYRDGRYRGGEARVIDAQPLYASGDAKQECWNPRAGHYEEVRSTSDNKVLNKGTALGALIGGVAGHQVDSGTGTAVGALLGGLIGNQVNKRDNRDDGQPDLDRTRCRVTAENGAQPRGYEVKYEYEGREYVTRTEREPGRRLRLGSDIRDDGTPFELASNYR